MATKSKSKAAAAGFDIAAIRVALATPATSADLETGRNGYGRWGAHRAYIEILGLKKPLPENPTAMDRVMGCNDYSAKARASVQRALQAAGAKLMPLHGCGKGLGVYLGYDNFEGGRFAAQGLAAVRALQDLGIACCVEAAGD